jgi:hypothetical protein
MYVPQRPSMFPIAPMGKLLTCLPQLTLAQLRMRQLQSVSAAETLKNSHRPMGNSRFARCLQGGGGVAVYGGSVSIVNSQIYSNFGEYVRAHVQKFPSAQWETHICLLLAGRRCLRRIRHGHDNVFLDLREYRLRCACSCSKVPIAPMGDSHLLVACREAVSTSVPARSR